MKHLKQEMVEQLKRAKQMEFVPFVPHPLVLEAAIRYASANQTPLLIEATLNQVDQFGGYTGMTPADFPRLCLSARRLVTTGCVDSG